MKVLVAQLCLALCDPMDCSPPGSSVHGLLQARVPEWIAMPSSGGLLDPGTESASPVLQANLSPSESQGKPYTKEMRTLIWKDTCTTTFAEVLFTIAKI